MTNITVFGQEEQGKDEKKPIEFVWLLDSQAGREPTSLTPANWENVCFLGRDEYDECDLIMAWDFDDTRAIFLGHWNDGIVA